MDERFSSLERPLARVSLHALHVFEAAARHASFRLAARELHLTPSAVSHQMRTLEAQLQVRLFERAARRVALTDPGRALYGGARRAFDELDAALHALRPAAAADTVTVSMTPAFAARWLIPRLAAFEEGHADVRVRVVSTNEVTPLGGGSDVDFAVRYGEPREPHLVREPLLDERFIAVASPAYARRLAAGGRATLLHVAWRSERFAQLDSAHFLERPGARGFGRAARDGATFEDESHAAAAALGGQGVALLSDVLVAELLATRALVRISDASLAGYRYHLVAPRERLARPPVAAFAAWLRGAARECAVGSARDGTRGRSAKRTRKHPQGRA